MSDKSAEETKKLRRSVEKGFEELKDEIGRGADATEEMNNHTQDQALAGNQMSGPSRAGFSVAGLFRRGAHHAVHGLQGKNTWILFLFVAVIHLWYILKGLDSTILSNPGFNLNFFGSLVRAIMSNRFFWIYFFVIPFVATWVFSGQGNIFRRFFYCMGISLVSFLEPLIVVRLLTAFNLPMWTGILLLFFSCIWIYFIISHSEDETITHFLAGLYMFGLIVVLFIMAFEAYHVETNDNPMPNPFDAAQLKLAAAKFVDYGFKKPSESAKTMVKDFKGLLNGTIASATQEYYTGQVDSSQGLPLGVFISKAEPERPKYYADSDSLAVSAIMKARSLADKPIEIENTCYITNEVASSWTSTTSSRVNGKIDPEKWSIDYTGEYQDQRDLYCTIDNADLQKIAPENRMYTPSVILESSFNFDTLAYMPYVFMERDLYNSLRRADQEPSQYLGISNKPIAKYTPGPVMLGMLQDTQPFAYTEGDALPSVGITVSSAWQGKGNVKSLDELHLYIPKQFEVLRETCTPAVKASSCPKCSSKATITMELKDRWDIPDPEHPDDTTKVTQNKNYWDYTVTGMQIAKGQTYTTIRCKLTRNMQGDGSSLPFLGTSGVGVYTLYAQAKYKYTIQTRVSTTIQGAGVGKDAVTSGTTTTTIDPIKEPTKVIIDGVCTSDVPCCVDKRQSNLVYLCDIKNTDGTTTHICRWPASPENKAGVTCRNA